MSSFRELVNCIEYSLRNEPQKWVADEFQAVNAEMPCAIWIANGLYGIDIEIPGWRIGDVNLFGFLIPWRWRLYRAATALQKNKHCDPIQRFLDAQYARVSAKETAA